MSSIVNFPAEYDILLQGNEAIARGALEAGLSWAGGYPGNPSSEIIETLARAQSGLSLYVEWSVNEKVALEAAAAASYAGLRSMVVMKQNGINVCLDALIPLALSGIKAGMVVVAADDPSGISSAHEQDSRFAAETAQIPLLEPSTPDEALAMTRFAFDISERLGTICLIRSVSRLSHTRANVRPGPLHRPEPRAVFDTTAAYVPLPAVPKHQAMYDQLNQARDIFESSTFNTYEGPDSPGLMVVTCGPCHLYCREALAMTGLTDRAGLLKIGTGFPLPSRFVLDHLAGVKEILVIEEVDPVLENRLKILAAENSPDIGPLKFHGKASGHVPAVGEMTPDLIIDALVRITGVDHPGETETGRGYRDRAAVIVSDLVPAREFGYCAGCPHRASFWAIKNALAVDDRDGYVVGDIGCYGMAMWPTGYRQIKTMQAMGSGTGLASGFGKLESFGFDQPVISVVGDSTFFHAAIPALVNAAYHRSGFLLCVLDNSATAMTGFQPHPGTGYTALGEEVQRIDIESVCASLKVDVTVCDPYDLRHTEEVLTEALENLKTVRVVVLRRKCALIQGREQGFPFRMRVDENLCRGDNCGCNRYCTRVFRCPGLTWNEKTGRAMIDEVVCVGCGVCEQICPAGAIVGEEKK